jgi:hypothetical protein
LRELGRHKRLEEEVMREARVPRDKGPLIYLGNLRPGHVRSRSQTCPANRICPGQRPDISGENCLDSSGNFVNRLKTQYSTNFGVGPIEYIYVW